jgi:ubiquinone biosynthesis protein
VVAEVENTLAAELDLQREGANRQRAAPLLGKQRRPVRAGSDLEPHRRARADPERVWGIPSDDIAALDKAGIDRKALAAKGVRVFYTQVFRDNFFHADAHAGNIWVDTDPARRANPRFIALDFGIMGQLAGRSVLPGRELHGHLQPRLPPHRRTARAGALDARQRAHR